MSARVGPEQLRAELELGDPPLLLDVRWTLAGPDRDGYRAGHLPGAVFCDLDTDLADPPGAGGRHPLPSRGRLVESLHRLGVGPGTGVVVYDGGVAAAAARAWWCLRSVGHEDVRVLDGGLPAWVETGGALESGEVSPALHAAPLSGARAAAGDGRQTTEPPSEADAAIGNGRQTTERPSGAGAAAVEGPRTIEVEEILAGQAGVLLDARAPERFRGEVEPIDPVAGHIPGARSLPTTGLLDDDGRYLPTAALRELFAAAGADGEQPVAAYCGSGVSAAQLVLAGHEAGIDIALYAGSWSHWITDPGRPVATGPA